MQLFIAVTSLTPEARNWLAILLGLAIVLVLVRLIWGFLNKPLPVGARITLSLATFASLVIALIVFITGEGGGPGSKRVRFTNLSGKKVQGLEVKYDTEKVPTDPPAPANFAPSLMPWPAEIDKDDTSPVERERTDLSANLKYFSIAFKLKGMSAATYTVGCVVSPSSCDGHTNCEADGQNYGLEHDIFEVDVRIAQQDPPTTNYDVTVQVTFHETCEEDERSLYRNKTFTFVYP